MSIFGKKIGVALSGGGYKGAAYHIGTLRALHRLGVLDKVDVISSASGGSITAAYYALNKDDYEEFERGFIKRRPVVVLPVSWHRPFPAVGYVGGNGTSDSQPHGILFPVPPHSLGCLCGVGRCHHLFLLTHSFPEVFVCYVADK